VSWNEPRKDISLIRGSVLPEDVLILSGPRCGDADRDRANSRVGEAYAKGYLSKDEAEARRDAIGKATMQEHLTILTADLPGISRWSGASLPPKKPVKRAESAWQWWQSRQPLTGIAGILSGLLVAVMPGLSVSVAWPHDGGLVAVVAAPTVAAGVVAFFTGLISMVSAMDV
jgi:Domain of unknown function (DUF1707)